MRSRAAIASLLLLAAAPLGGCSGNAPDAPSRPDVILISLDTLRPDHLGAYGYGRPTSPVLDALAEEGVLFEDVTSPSPWTLPAHGSLLTGLYPSRHHANFPSWTLAQDVPTLASILSGHGYGTAAIVNSHLLTERYGLSRGIERLRYVQELVFEVRPSTAVTDQALEWLSAPRERPLFLFLHYYDAHSDYRSLSHFEDAFVRDYDGPADGTTAQLVEIRNGELSIEARDAEHLRDLYDAGIRQLDEELGRLLVALRERGLLDRSLLVITSDHGEEFLEHGSVLHGRTQYQEVLRVPLLMRGAGLPVATRVSTPVSVVDVAPTILARLGIATPDGLDGIDLAPLWRGEVGAFEGRILFGEADHSNEIDDMTRSVRQGRWVLHYDRSTEGRALYDLAKDPGETRDVAAANPEVAERLQGKLLAFIKATHKEALTRMRPPESLTRDEFDHLRQLGYFQ